MVGLPVFLGPGAICLHAFVQVPGYALRMQADHLREEVRREGELVRLLLCYTHALLAQTALVSACNRIHPMEQRCARWLLQVRDRTHSDQFQLTQKFLSQMLGVRRASVTLAAGMLQQAGLIRYQRGKITIVNRQGLEEVACECYASIRRERERALPPL
jgi:CRP-like cAMP-binding protein